MIFRYIPKKHFVIFVLLVLLGLLFWLSAAFQKEFFRGLEALAGFFVMHPLLGVVIFLVLTILSALFVFFSTVALVPISIYIWGQTLTFMVLFLGWVFGGVISYLIGKYLGRRVVEYFISAPRLEYYERRITQKTNLFVMFLFRLLAPSEIPGYLLGIIRYRFTKYLLITFFAELPFAWGAVYASEIFLQQEFLYFAGFLLVAGLVYLVLRRRFHEEIAKLGDKMP